MHEQTRERAANVAARPARPCVAVVAGEGNKELFRTWAATRSSTVDSR